MESKDGMSAADILHVQAGQNYLVEDFTRMERLRSDPVVLGKPLPCGTGNRL